MIHDCNKIRLKSCEPVFYLNTHIKKTIHPQTVSEPSPTQSMQTDRSLTRIINHTYTHTIPSSLFKPDESSPISRVIST